MDHAARTRDFAIVALLRVVLGGLIAFVLAFVAAPALVSAHDTLLLWLGVAAVIAAILAAVQTLYGLWRTWSRYRLAQEQRA